MSLSRWSSPSKVSRGSFQQPSSSSIMANRGSMSNSLPTVWLTRLLCMLCCIVVQISCDFLTIGRSIMLNISKNLGCKDLLVVPKIIKNCEFFPWIHYAVNHKKYLFVQFVWTILVFTWNLRSWIINFLFLYTSSG